MSKPERVFLVRRGSAVDLKALSLNKPGSIILVDHIDDVVPLDLNPPVHREMWTPHSGPLLWIGVGLGTVVGFWLALLVRAFT